MPPVCTHLHGAYGGGGWEEREGKEGFRKNGKKERNKKNKKVKGAAEKKANEDR